MRFYCLRHCSIVIALFGIPYKELLTNKFMITLLENIFFPTLFGAILGTTIGVLPGLGPIVALSITLPFTYDMPLLSAISAMAAIYYGAQFGGSASAILLNIPGTPGASMTAIDGHALALKGEGGKALLVAFSASLVGSLVGVLFLMTLTKSLATLAIYWGPIDYAYLMLFGLLLVPMLSKGNTVEGIWLVLCGLLLGAIGTDLTTGTSRLTFGVAELMDGLHITPVAVGLFGVSQLIGRGLEKNPRHILLGEHTSSYLPKAREWSCAVGAAVRGALVGCLLGIAPGAGATLAAFFSYSFEKQRVVSNDKNESYSQIRGVAAPEAANNAAAVSSFIPTLALGIPGDAAMTLMLSALALHGVQPGPSWLAGNEAVFHAIILSMLIGNIIVFSLNVPLIKIWSKLLTIPMAYWRPVLLVTMVTGVYSANNSVVDVITMMIFGIIGAVLIALHLSVVPLFLGYMFSSGLEENVRRAWLIADGDLYYMLTSKLLIICVGLVVLHSVIKIYKNHARRSLS